MTVEGVEYGFRRRTSLYPSFSFTKGNHNGSYLIGICEVSVYVYTLRGVLDTLNIFNKCLCCYCIHHCSSHPPSLKPGPRGTH